MRRKRRDLIATLSHWAAASDRWYGIYLSLLLAVVAAVAAMGGVLVFLLWVARDVATYPAMDAPQQQANALAVMQVAGGIIGAGITAFAFVFAFGEFVRNRAQPALELVFIDEVADIAVSRVGVAINTDNPQMREVQLAIRNNGNLTAVWFMVEIEAPHLAAAIKQAASSWKRDSPMAVPPPFDHRGVLRAYFTPEDGRGNWYYDWHERHERVLYRYESHGEVAVYPGATMRLGRLRVFWDPAKKSRHLRFPYRIFTDRSGRVEDRLSIELDPQTPGVVAVNRPRRQADASDSTS